MAGKKLIKKTRRAGRRDPAPGGLAPARTAATGLPDGYAELLADLKTRVRAAQVKAALSVNRELIQLYWDIGKRIVDRQEREGWGKSVIERLAGDLQKAFPGVGGFSKGNVWRMRAFYLAYTQDVANLAQAARQLTTANLAQAARELDRPALPQAALNLPWFHNVILLEKVKDPHERLWYAQQACQHGWSRAILTVQIETDLYRRKGQAVTNFAATLPAPQSDLAQQTLKDPYLFDFLTLADEAHERDLESGLTAHIQKFLVELGVGFAFVGRQVSLQVDGEDFFIDLLFYHLKLRSFVIIDLKMKGFQPADAGQMNFYLSAVDNQMRHADDKPSIGLILCKSSNRIIAEYALRDVNKPIGVAEWQTRLVKSLPENLRASLPTIAELEAELGRELRA
jgi:predicted nuclease of restriction endonuclease-like (RecB) superfamily